MPPRLKLCLPSENCHNWPKNWPTASPSTATGTSRCVRQNSSPTSRNISTSPRVKCPPTTCISMKTGNGRSMGCTMNPIGFASKSGKMWKSCDTSLALLSNRSFIIHARQRYTGRKQNQGSDCRSPSRQLTGIQK